MASALQAGGSVYTLRNARISPSRERSGPAMTPVQPSRRRHAARRVQHLHDVRVVRPPEAPAGLAVVPRGARELGHRALRVPAAGARQPHRLRGGITLAQLKIIQEVITLAVFVPFAMLYMGERFKWDYLWAALCMMGAVYFIFRTDMHLHILGICGTFMGGLAKIARRARPHRDRLRRPRLSADERPAARAGHRAARGLRRRAARSREGGPLRDRQRDDARQARHRGDPRPRACPTCRVRSGSPRTCCRTNGCSRSRARTARARPRRCSRGSSRPTASHPGSSSAASRATSASRARLGESPFFVIEADEYDTAFFDKRSKFVWYRPRTAVLGNLEYDHADIFPDLAAIETQFHHLVRIVPSQGLLVVERPGCGARARARARRVDAGRALRRGPGLERGRDPSRRFVRRAPRRREAGHRALAAHGRAQPHERARRARRRAPRGRACRRPRSSRSRASRA